MEKKIKVDKTARYYTLGNDITRAKRIWFVLHGYGQLAQYFIRNFEVLDPYENFIVAPEGFHRFYLEGLSGRVGASWMTKEDRETDIVDYVHFLSKVYFETIQGLDLKNTKITFFGFSQGVATASRWMVLGNVQFDEAIFWAGAFPPDLEPKKCEEIFSSVPVHCVVGKADEFISGETIEKSKSHFEAMGMKPKWHFFKGGHSIPKEALLEINKKLNS